MSVNSLNIDYSAESCIPRPLIFPILAELIKIALTVSRSAGCRILKFKHRVTSDRVKPNITEGQCDSQERRYSYSQKSQ